MNTAVCCMYDDLEALNVDVVDVKLKNNFAIAFFDNFLIIDRSKCKTAAQERTVLAHEAGHYMSGAFYRAYSPFEVKEQAEHRAFAASVEKYLPVNEILNCYKMGMTENWEIAEYFNLEEEFVEKAVIVYKTKKRPRCYQHRERSNRLAYSKRAVTTDTVIIPLLGRLVKVYPKEVILLWQDSKKEKMAAINAR